MLLQNGNISQCDWLMQTYGKAVLTFILRFVRVREDAEELRQDTFVKAFQNIGSYRGDAPISAWLLRIAYRQVLNHQRRRSLHMVSLEHAQCQVLSQPEPQGRKALLKKSIEQLSSEEKMLITLYYLDQIPLNEMAYTAGVSSNTLSARLYRIRKKLQEIIKRLENEECPHLRHYKQG